MSFANAQDAVTQAVTVIFERWTALVLTAEHQLGGDRKPIQQLLETTVNLAMGTTTRRCNVDDLTDHLYAAFDRLHTDVEDGSPEQVAAVIVSVRDAACKGDFSLAAQIVGKARSSSAHGNAVSESVGGTLANANADAGGAEGDGNDSMQVERQPQPPMVDDDGFTSVSHGGRHR